MNNRHLLVKCCVSFQKLGESVQQLLATKIAVYLMTFLIVTVAWAAHVRYAFRNVLEKVHTHTSPSCELQHVACPRREGIL